MMKTYVNKHVNKSIGCILLTIFILHCSIASSSSFASSIPVQSNCIPDAPAYDPAALVASLDQANNVIETRNYIESNGASNQAEDSTQNENTGDTMDNPDDENLPPIETEPTDDTPRLFMPMPQSIEIDDVKKITETFNDLEEKGEEIEQNIELNTISKNVDLIKSELDTLGIEDKIEGNKLTIDQNYTEPDQESENIQRDHSKIVSNNICEYETENSFKEDMTPLALDEKEQATAEYMALIDTGEITHEEPRFDCSYIDYTGFDRGVIADLETAKEKLKDSIGDLLQQDEGAVCSMINDGVAILILLPPSPLEQDASKDDGTPRD